MSVNHQHALFTAAAFACILALVVFAVHAQSSETTGDNCTPAQACDASAAAPRGEAAASATRSAARAHLTMPYFSYARALPRNTEL